MALMDVFTHFSIIRRERRGIRPEEIKEFKKEQRESYLLNADITSFYDSVSPHYLINNLFDLTGSILPQKYKPLLQKILQPEIEFYSVADKLLKLEKKNKDF
jgi:hypothetical protein